jgi:Xaa-Pro aminopeptidase
MAQSTIDVEAVTRFLEDGQSRLATFEPTIPFSREEYASRLQRLRKAMADTGVQTLLLFSPEAMCWLHGLSLRWYKSGGPRQWPPLTCCAVNVDSDKIIAFEGEEHAEMMRLTSVAEDLRLLPRYDRPDMLNFIVGELAAERWLAGKVGLEKYSYIPNPAIFDRVQQALTAQGATITDASGIIRGVRRLKSPAEIAYVERAAEICDAGILHLQSVLAPGMTEVEAHAELLLGMARAGGERAALHEMVAISTPVGGLGHHISTAQRVITAGDWVEVDPCGVFNNYHANRNAYYYMGEPPQVAQDLMGLLGGAYQVLTTTATVGTPVSEVTRALREYYQNAGVWHLNNRYWVGGYELGISFPPDWVGDWLYTVASDEDQGVIEDGLVTNYESIIGLGVLDTVVYQNSGTRTLSKIPYEVLGITW